jgi:hypothetical protein
VKMPPQRTRLRRESVVHRVPGFANRLCEYEHARGQLVERLIDVRERYRQGLDGIRTAHAAPEVRGRSLEFVCGPRGFSIVGRRGKHACGFHRLPMRTPIGHGPHLGRVATSYSVG